MNHEIKHALRRIGRGTATYLDETLITDYIKELEQSEGRIAEAWETATQRANDLSTELARLRKQLAGPAGVSFVVFVPGDDVHIGRNGDGLRMTRVAAALREASDAVLREVGRKVGQEAAKDGD